MFSCVKIVQLKSDSFQDRSRSYGKFADTVLNPTVVSKHLCLK